MSWRDAELFQLGFDDGECSLGDEAPGLYVELNPVFRLHAVTPQLGQGRVAVQSIHFRKDFLRRRWMRGSSPRMTAGQAFGGGARMADT
jgi:hypothetical protein